MPIFDEIEHIQELDRKARHDADQRERNSLSPIEHTITIWLAIFLLILILSIVIFAQRFGAPACQP